MTMKGGPNFTEMREKALDESIKKDTTTHFLGEGTEKFVWWTGKEPLVVINSKSRQGRHTDGKKKQRVEYYFTQKLKKEKGIGEHIPNVYEIDSSYRFSKDKGENEQFRYLKEKTTPFSDVNSCLNAMMKLNRICIRHGFSYIDFKPANVGRINSEAFLIDTDPAFFFKIPEELKALFEIENQMTALLSIYNYGRCSHETKKALKEFIQRDKVLTVENIESVLRNPTITMKQEQEIRKQRLAYLESCIDQTAKDMKLIFYPEKYEANLLFLTPIHMCIHYGVPISKRDGDIRPTVENIEHLRETFRSILSEDEPVASSSQSRLTKPLLERIEELSNSDSNTDDSSPKAPSKSKATTQKARPPKVRSPPKASPPKASPPKATTPKATTQKASPPKVRSPPKATPPKAEEENFFNAQAEEGNISKENVDKAILVRNQKKVEMNELVKTARDIEIRLREHLKKEHKTIKDIHQIESKLTKAIPIKEKLNESIQKISASFPQYKESIESSKRHKNFVSKLEPFKNQPSRRTPMTPNSNSENLNVAGKLAKELKKKELKETEKKEQEEEHKEMIKKRILKSEKNIEELKSDYERAQSSLALTRQKEDQITKKINMFEQQLRELKEKRLYESQEEATLIEELKRTNRTKKQTARNFVHKAREVANLSRRYSKSIANTIEKASYRRLVEAQGKPHYERYLQEFASNPYVFNTGLNGRAMPEAVTPPDVSHRRLPSSHYLHLRKTPFGEGIGERVKRSLSRKKSSRKPNTPSPNRSSPVPMDTEPNLPKGNFPDSDEE